MTEPEGLSADQIQFVTRGVTPEEIAAVTAVLTAAAAEQHAESAERTPDGPDGWARSQRGLREAVHPAAGAWRSFSG